MTELLRAMHLYAHANLPPARIGGARLAAALPEGFNELRRDIAGLCNNVNQIARAVHMNARDASRAASDARRYAGKVYEMLTEWMSRGV